jgi:restriction endonuclease S subunit
MSELVLENAFDLPKGWKIKTAKELFYIKGRIGWRGLKKSDFTKNGPYLITGVDFKNGEINWEKCYHIPMNKFLESPEIIIQKNDILLTKDGTIGKVAFIKNIPDVQASLNGHLFLIRNLEGNGVYQLYLYYLLHSPYFFIFSKLNQTGTTRPALPQRVFERFPIPLPPLNEQKRIVEKIEELFSLVDSVEQILIQTKNQFKFYYSSILKFYFDYDYEILKLNDVCDLLSGKAFKKSEYSTDGIRLFQIANVSFGKITWDDIAYLPSEYLKKYPELELKDGDVIMALNRPIIRRQIKVGMLSPSDVPSILYQRVGKFVLSNNIIPKFLFYFLQSSMFIKQLESSLQGIDIPFINKSKLMSFSIPLPTLNEQKMIVQKIEEKFTLIQNTENSTNLLLLKIPLIKNTILKQAFEGKLVPQDPNDEPAEILLEKIKQEKEQLIQKQKPSRSTKNVK